MAKPQYEYSEMAKIRGWVDCECCDNCFKAPQFPAPTLCPDCAAKADEDEAPNLMLQH